MKYARAAWSSLWAVVTGGAIAMAPIDGLGGERSDLGPAPLPPALRCLCSTDDDAWQCQINATDAEQSADDEPLAEDEPVVEDHQVAEETAESEQDGYHGTFEYARSENAYGDQYDVTSEANDGEMAAAEDHAAPKYDQADDEEANDGEMAATDDNAAPRVRPGRRRGSQRRRNGNNRRPRPRRSMTRLTTRKPTTAKWRQPTTTPREV